MGKPRKDKSFLNYKDVGTKHGKRVSERTSKAFDEDTSVFINMSQELKEEGNKLFQRQDFEGSMLKYEKALKLLPINHIDVAYLHNKMAACYMQMGFGEYPRAIHECNLALEIAPKYSKALLKRARCYEALNILDLALRDVNIVLNMVPNNLNALEIADRVKRAMEDKRIIDKEIVLPLPLPLPLPLECIKPQASSEKKVKKKKSRKFDKIKVDDIQEHTFVESKDVIVVEEKRSVKEEKIVTRTVKLIFQADIRYAQLPNKCSIRLVRDIVLDRFPNLQGVLIKYKDQDSDFVTLTTTDELRLAEASCENGVLRLYITEISAAKEPYYELISNDDVVAPKGKTKHAISYGNRSKGQTSFDDWIIQFARMFKNHVGFDYDSYLDLHEIGMKIYSEAMKESVTSENAQGLFDIAASKFQEMVALAMFNWGNVHMSRARKRVFITEDSSKDTITTQIKSAYEYAQNEYAKAAMKYEQALKIKPDFYDGVLALGQQQFEQAKISWYYLIGTKADLETEASAQVLDLYNKAEDNMEKGVQMWEEIEEQRLNGLSIVEKQKTELQKFGLEGLLKEMSADEAIDQAANMRSQIYLLWGTLLYERSVVEFKLSLPTWEECLEVGIEKFELAGASQIDIAVMIKNHCSNETSLEGFKVDEIVQAWNEMYDADRWQFGLSSFRLEPLFRRRAPKLHSMLEHF